MNTDADVSSNTWVVDEDNMVSDLDTKVPTQQSVKAYVDSQLGSGNLPSYTNVSGLEIAATEDGAHRDRATGGADADFNLPASPSDGDRLTLSTIKDTDITEAYSTDKAQKSPMGTVYGIGVAYPITEGKIYTWIFNGSANRWDVWEEGFHDNSLVSYVATGAINLTSTGATSDINLTAEDSCKVHGTNGVTIEAGNGLLVRGKDATEDGKLQIVDKTGDIQFILEAQETQVAMYSDETMTFYTTSSKDLNITASNDLSLTASGGSVLLDADPTVALGAATKQYVDNVAGVPIMLTKNNGDSPYTASWYEDIEVDCSGGNVTINLPTASGNAGKDIWITRTDNSANTLTIDGDLAETINGQTTQTINNQWTSLTLRSDGTNVRIR
jgi:hypothetical protein